MSYGDFKTLPKRTVSAEMLRDKALILVQMQKMTDIKRSCFHGL